MCEDCKRHKWYARALAQMLRDSAEHGEDMPQAERDAKRLAAYHLGRVFEDWPGKYAGMSETTRR